MKPCTPSSQRFIMLSVELRRRKAATTDRYLTMLRLRGAWSPRDPGGPCTFGSPALRPAAVCMPRPCPTLPTPGRAWRGTRCVRTCLNRQPMSQGVHTQALASPGLPEQAMSQSGHGTRKLDIRLLHTPWQRETMSLHELDLHKTEAGWKLILIKIPPPGEQKKKTCRKPSNFKLVARNSPLLEIQKQRRLGFFFLPGREGERHKPRFCLVSQIQELLYLLHSTEGCPSRIEGRQIRGDDGTMKRLLLSNVSRTYSALKASL